MNPPRWKHQDAAFEFAKLHPAACNLAMAMRTGKTRVVSELLVEWNCDNALVFAPVSVLRNWKSEIDQWTHGMYRVVVLDKGTVAKQTEAATRAVENGDPVVLVQNYESAWREPFSSFCRSRVWKAVIADESHRFKSHSSRIAKFMMLMHDRAMHRLCLTGTPMPHSPLDVFGQFRFLDWRLFGKRWMPFVSSYAIRGNPMIPQQITGYQNLDVLQERFGRLTFQVASDVLELPPEQHIQRTFELPPAARRIYDDIENEFIAQVGSGVVTAANALVKTLRLRQAVSGFVQPDDEEKLVDIHDGKEQLLADILADLPTTEPVIVFAEFVKDLNTIRKVALAAGRRYGEVSGRRNDLDDRAMMPADIDLMGVNYRSGGVGVNLSRANYAVVYSPCYSLGDYDQAMARPQIKGKLDSVAYYHLIAEKTIDIDVYRALRNKRNVIEGVLSALRKRQAG